MTELFTETTGTTTDAADEPRKYNVYGIISKMLMKGQGKRVLTFELQRKNGTVLPCVAFGKTIDAIVKDGFRNGAEVKVWGYYNDQTFQGRDGIDRQRTEFRLLKVSAALPPKEAQAEGTAGATAEAPAEAPQADAAPEAVSEAAAPSEPVVETQAVAAPEAPEAAAAEATAEQPAKKSRARAKKPQAEGAEAPAKPRRSRAKKAVEADADCLA